MILLAEDDDGFREFMTALLREAGYDTCATERGDEVVPLARASRPRLVLLDVQMPGISGYEICRQLRDEFGSDLAIAFVSGTRTESFDKSAGLLVGADDYIVKPFAPDEFLARVRALIRRANGNRPTGGPSEPTTNGHELTPRELEVLRLLGDGLSHGEIAQRLVISPKTVGTHVEHIFGKLGVRSRAQALALAYREHLIEQ